MMGWSEHVHEIGKLRKLLGAKNLVLYTLLDSLSRMK